MGRKLGGRLCPFGVGPRLTQCGKGRGLPPIHTKCHLDPCSRMATTDMGRKLGAGVPPWGVGPHLTQCGKGRGLPPIHTKCHLDPCSRGHNTWAKIGGAVLWGHRCPPPPLQGGERGPHLTQCRLGEVYLRTKWHLYPSSSLATTDMDQNWGCAPFEEGELRPHLKHCGRAEAYLHAKLYLDSSNSLATILQRHRQTGHTNIQTTV